MFILFLIFVAVIIWAYFKYIKKTKYRVVLTDPVTGYIKYLSKVDGINSSFEYSTNSDNAIIFDDVNRAIQFIKGVDDKAKPTIESKKVLNWHVYSGEE
ncbi:hypothetical protein RD055328_01420 [Companilactobacillus sp. RD055328]|uniref:hypothetical protein n=1 Tax=Companilactobacillus sp. RD055328 TaxID=2916634 RepID=UPI001FC8B1FB|nr:hypothetical protein [Companilactobacillus sp. RD055328]GKQ42219.1 hypothetical protein RD055328_01420 [Companilactobacillus sp. RD055328]